MRELAVVICGLFVLYLFRSDVRSSPGVSRAIWIPTMWMFIAGSRYASSWLDLSPPMASVDAYSEGSPIDRAVFLLLILSGAAVLVVRKIDWGRLATRNILIVLYFGYCLLSVLWADEPFVSFKRLFKDLGNAIMALVLLTERNPYEAVGVTLRRLAFLFLPLSVLFIRYFPHLGRTFHVDGSPMYTGVGHQKNDLGSLCLITGIYFAWDILTGRRDTRGWRTDTRAASATRLVLMSMLGWLLYMSNSQTSLFCLFVVVFLLLAARLPPLRRRPARVVPVAAFAAVLLGLGQSAFGLKDEVFRLLGRDSTLTNRTELWEVVRSLEVDAWTGAGFMSFWTGERMEKVWAHMGMGVNQAHSGYLEQYLNLGWIGVGFMGALLLVGLTKTARALKTDPRAGMLRLSFLITAVLYNYTEASFYGINTIWMLTLVAIIDPPAAPRRHEIPPRHRRRPLEQLREV